MSLRRVIEVYGDITGKEQELDWHVKSHGLDVLQWDGKYYIICNDPYGFSYDVSIELYQSLNRIAGNIFTFIFPVFIQFKSI